MGANVSNNLPIKGCGNFIAVLSERLTWAADFVSDGAVIETVGKETTLLKAEAPLFCVFGSLGFDTEKSELILPDRLPIEMVKVTGI